ncbi:hypothetical protein BGZ61DRAFT_483079 [Ilyonectria robusta]|uniref:uncharacterized protein n=1 Tax=Ilyonectria robusta TaxID=1079257 RepID=UPI001E8E19B0|nr:uncharacterized protein BGZ61DRAFT_483079 [Ilyonectria robusta]KAH8670735.1 hypothetical protein BGZ61DRAFT_483079 [Ilyonectria robusta]
MDSSLSALLERLRGRTPGSTLSSLGLKTYNDIFSAANSNTNATPRESHSTVQPSIIDRVPDVRPVGLALRRSHSTVQPSTLGYIPETVPIDPALGASQSTGQSSKPVPAQPLIAPNPTQAAEITNASQYHPHNALGMQQCMSILSFSDVDQHGQQELGAKRKADQHGQEQNKRQNRRHVENSNLEEQTQAFKRAIKHLEDEFTEKERISYTKDWRKPVPRERNISTVMDFYQAFHNMDTLPIHTCMICYQKISMMEIKELSWEEWTNSAAMNSCRTYSCPDCFPVGKAIPSCDNCAMKIRECNMSRGGNLHQALGCEHMYPDALRDLTLVEEKLIALNTHFGFVARIKVTKSTKQSTAYARHVKGHITVFPNSVQDLVTTVLPHPLLQSLEDIHISWHGPQRPAPSDLSKLLSVRRGAVERALLWLKEFNPHYRHIQIDKAELDSWGEPAHGVPSQIYDRIERDEPSAWEETRTAHIVPPAERGMDDAGPQSLEQIVDGLGRAYDENDVSYDEDQQLYDECSREELEYEGMGSFLDEILASGMFPLDTAPRATDADKLRFAIDTIRGGHTNAQTQPPNQSTGSAQDCTFSHTFTFQEAMSLQIAMISGILQKHFQHYSLRFGGPRCKEEMESDLWKNSVQLTGMSVIETVLERVERVERMRFANT